MDKTVQLRTRQITFTIVQYYKFYANETISMENQMTPSKPDLQKEDVYY